MTLAIVSRSADSKPAEFSKTFISKAKEADKDIRRQWNMVERSYIELGRECRDFSSKKYHLALGFKNFGEWAGNVFGKSAATIFAQMRVSKLLTEKGPGRIADSDLKDISASNAGELAKLPPKIRTQRKVIEAAKSMTTRQFQTDVVFPALKKSGRTDADEPVVRVGPWSIRKSIADMVEEGHKMAFRLNRNVDAEDQEHDRTAMEKALESIYGSFIAENQAEYDQLVEADAEQEKAAIR